MYPQYFTRFEPSPAARVFAADLAERRSTAISDKRLLAWCVAVFAGMLASFVIATQLRVPLSLIPLAGAGIILMVYELRLRKTQSLEATMDKVQRKNVVGDEISKVLAEVHWDVVLFLAALFVVIGSLEHTDVLTWAADFILGTSRGDPVRASLLIVLIASFITMSAEAGPATAVFVPVIRKLGALGAGIGSGGLLYWALSFGVQAGSSTTMIGANEGPLAARMIEQDARMHDSSNRLTARGFTRIGGRMWLVFIPLSIVYLTGLILLGAIVSLLAFVIALIVALWIAVRGL
jgi:Na+/H+ antiporter NhaD/arsenite permease-like protein